MYYYTKTEINMPLAQTSICVFRRPMVVPGLIHYTCIWCSIYIFPYVIMFWQELWE